MHYAISFPKLMNFHVQGLPLKLKRFIDEIPQDVIELADSLEFPIIQIPETLTLGAAAHQLLSFI